MKGREFLELAAKAAGYLECKYFGFVEGVEWWQVFDGQRWLNWNPRDNDGDALRLAVKLRMEIDHNHPSYETPWVSVREHPMRMCYVEDLKDESQRAVATRRAIVRVAAEIGRSMP